LNLHMNSIYKRHLFTVILSLVLCPFFSFSCNCPDAKPVTKELVSERYPVVFYGKVLSFRDHEGKFQVRFQVIEPYVGKLPKEIEITDPNSDCSLGFGEGQTWIIYARYWKFGMAGTDMCSPSRKQFEKETDDYNISLRGTRFSEEREFLKKNFGVQPFLSKTKEEELLSQRELIKPKGYGMVWLVLAGTLCLGLFYFLFNKLFK
jgi:hypothetical protein